MHKFFLHVTPLPPTMREGRYILKKSVHTLKYNQDLWKYSQISQEYSQDPTKIYEISCFTLNPVNLLSITLNLLIKIQNSYSHNSLKLK